MAIAMLTAAVFIGDRKQRLPMGLTPFSCRDFIYIHKISNPFTSTQLITWRAVKFCILMAALILILLLTIRYFLIDRVGCGIKKNPKLYCLYVRENLSRGIEMLVIDRQASLVSMMQDAIAIELEKGHDVSALVANLKHLIDMLNVLSLLGTTVGQVNQKRKVDEGDRRREEYERDVRRQYARMKQGTALPPPTQYVYGDGFQGVTMPDERQQQARQQPYRLEEKEYWDDEQQ